MVNTEMTEREKTIAMMMAMDRNRRIQAAHYAITHRRRITLRGALLETTALNSGFNPCHPVFIFDGAPKREPKKDAA